MRPTYLLRELVRRDLTSRYRGSLLGFLWAFVHPLWQLALYTLVFSWILRIPLSGEGTASFPAFLFAGLLPWLGFSEGLMRSATAVVDQGNLVRKHRFPSELLVVSVALSAVCHQLAALALFAVWQGFCGGLQPAQSVWLVPGLIVQFAITLGLGWATASAQVFFRDVAQIAGVALSAGFYLTPIVYPLSLVPEAMRSWVLFNPLATVVAAFRAALVGGRPPTSGAWLTAAIVATLVAVAGWSLFRRLRSSFADEL